MRRVGASVRNDTKAHRVLGVVDRIRGALYPTAADAAQSAKSPETAGPSSHAEV
jgi:hypothetical protein